MLLEDRGAESPLGTDEVQAGWGGRLSVEEVARSDVTRREDRLDAFTVQTPAPLTSPRPPPKTPRILKVITNIVSFLQSCAADPSRGW